MTTPVLTQNAKIVLEKRYLWRDEEGNLKENPGELFARVARAIASVEKRAERSAWNERFFDIMVNRKFLPNSPTLMNAGRPNAQLSACFVLPVEDSLDGIFASLRDAAKIHQSGGGTGFSFSRLRPRGSVVRSSHGISSGPVSFMRVYDTATDAIKQGGTRRGANMGVLRVDHPDIFEFIDSKRGQDSILNFNISVGITDDFMRALLGQGGFELCDPRNGRKVRAVNPSELFDRITQAAWECGDPGMVFIDRINLFNPTPRLGAMESTNPCGEQPLLPYESCNLGSLNLGEYFVNGRGFDWEGFRKDIRTAIRFLDDVIDANAYPVLKSEKLTLLNRKIGLGVMGLADLLLLIGIPYSSPRAREVGERIMSFLDRESKRCSIGLAEERGAFPNWKGSLWQNLGYPRMRNATVSTVAPTGTISMIAGASSGIEPIFSGIFYRNVLSGEKLLEIHPAVEKVLAAKEIRVEGAGLSRDFNDNFLVNWMGEAWAPASRVPVEDHVRMQAVFQRHSDSAVSKTINLPENATIQDVKKAYLLAYELGCKGITVYRDKSRPAQVLEKAAQNVVTGEICENC